MMLDARWVIPVAAALGAGCMRMGDSETASKLHAQLKDREQAHHDHAVGTTEPVAIRDETAGYAVDMHAVLGGMSDVCSDMMASGAAREDDARTLGVASGRIVEAVDAHEARVGGLADLEGLRTECEEHHRAMLPLIDEMRTSMRCCCPMCAIGH